jgi:oligoribonuclease (3'-5' exoribonuclease)
MEKIREKARKKHPKIGQHEQKADAFRAKADMHQAMADMHGAKARAMLAQVTQVMSKSEK